MTAEEQVISGLSAKLVVPVSGDVPPSRPDRFVTVERTGGPRSEYGLVDRPRIAVQSWATTRSEAAELADVVDMAMHGLVGHQGIRAVTTETISNFPAEGPHPRYQGLYTLVVKTI